MRTYLLAAAAALLVIPGSARASTIFSVPAVIANAGSTGNSFDVVLNYSGASPITVGGFAFEITTTNTDITFTGATTSTVPTYIFGANSLFGPNINTSTGQTLDASDLDSNPAGASLATGTYGLGHVTFDVANGAAAGPFAITLTELGSSLSDADGNSLPITLSNGTITINSVSSVPEPSSLALALSALCVLAALRKRGR